MSVKKSFLCFACLIALILNLALATEVSVNVNLLRNGGFEAAADSIPGWQAVETGFEPGTIDREVFYAGKQALRVEDNQGMQSDFIPYYGGRIKVSGWVKTQNVVSGQQPWNIAALQVISYDKDKKLIRYGGEFAHVDIVLLDGNNDWQYYEGTVQLSRDVSYLSVWCYIWNGTGTAWFDEISVEYLDDPSELVRRPIDLNQAEVTVDFTKDLGEFKHVWIGSDLTYMDATPTSTMKNAMDYAQRYGFRYMRSHDSIVDTGIYSEDVDGNPRYDWSRFDSYFGTIIESGYFPIVVLETMPPEIAGYDSGQGYTNPYPPKDEEGYLKWQKLVYEIVKHCKEKWGEDIYQWYFEVWNEPDASGYFKGTFEEYLKIYDHAVAGATAADPNIRIGGPGGAADSWVIPLLEHCSSGINHATGEIGTRIDFISWHIYTVGVGLPVFDVLESRLATANKLREQFPQYKNLPILITEWGCSASEHPVHDLPYDAAFRTMAIRKLMDYGIELGLPYGLAEGPYTDFDGFRGALGLFTKTTIPKPSFRAMQLLGRMLGRRVEVTTSNDPVDGLAVFEKNGKKAWVMLYNLIENYTLEYTTTVTLNLKGLPEGKWSGSTISIASGSCDPYQAWVEMGKPAKLTPAQHADLLAASELPEAKPLEIKGQQLVIQMPSSSVLFLELKKED